MKANFPFPVYVGVIVHVPYTETNLEHELSVRLLTEDGQPYPEDDPAVVTGKFEIGRPPRMRHGEESNVPLVVSLPNFTFALGGYTWEALIDGERVATAPFTALESV